MWDDPGPVDVLRIEALLDALASERACARRRLGSGARRRDGRGSLREGRALLGATAAPTAQAAALLPAADGAGRRGRRASSTALYELEQRDDDFKLGRALEQAADAPLRIAEACADVAELGRCAGRARRGSSTQPDARVGSGARCGRCARGRGARRGESRRERRRRARAARAEAADRPSDAAAAAALMTPPLASVPDLERELDALYDLPLEEFTKARNDLSHGLRKAHQSDAAAEMRALKKPTVVAWSANRLARDEPELTARCSRPGERLRETQQRALQGNAKQDEVDEAAAAERETIRALLTAARRRLRRPRHLGAPRQALADAACSGGRSTARQLLERGRLTEELQAVGFGPLEAVKPAATPGRRGRTRGARARVGTARGSAAPLRRGAGSRARAGGS